jgi:hypothetical protein
VGRNGGNGVGREGLWKWGSGGWLEGEGVAKGKRPGGGRLFGEGESVFLFM